MTDVLGRSWQLGTIQLDAQMPARFGLTYMGADNREHPVFVIHRALLGSFERFIGIVIEHYGGAFPLWLAPVQVKLLPVAEPHHDAVEALALALREEGVRVEVDARDETLGKRIRDAEVEKVAARRRLGRQGVGRRDGGAPPGWRGPGDAERRRARRRDPRRHARLSPRPITSLSRRCVLERPGSHGVRLRCAAPDPQASSNDCDVSRLEGYAHRCTVRRGRRPAWPAGRLVGLCHVKPRRRGARGGTMWFPHVVLFSVCKQERHRPSPRRPRSHEVQPSRIRRGRAAAACGGFFNERGGSTRLGERPLRPRRRPEDRTRPVVQHDRINEQIRVPRVRLVGEDGEQIGIKDTKEALEYAYSKNLDLVEVAAGADPPVARVMDYGKYRYEQEQRAKQARKHQSTINVKEIKLRPKIGDPRLRDEEGPRHPVPQPEGEGEGHDHVPRAGEPAPGARSDASRAARRGRQGDRADRAAADARRSEHDHGAGPHEERRSETRCRR